jgi:ubiquinone/menaquinone biosynthesis C-methylase UbiE
MRMNRLEKWMMNNPVRAVVQRWYAAPLMERLGGALHGATVLEIGCGNGVGIEILLERFGAARVDAFDFDPEMTRLAARRVHRFGGRAVVWSGDAGRLPVPGARYDAVVAFGVLHHLPDWRAALTELGRVLRPGGRLIAEESYASFITHPVWRRLLEHPQADRFDEETLFAELERQGFQLLGSKLGFGGGLGWFAAERNGASS